MPRPHREISLALARRDPVMARLVAQHGPMHLPPPPTRVAALRAAGPLDHLPAARRPGRQHDLGPGAGAGPRGVHRRRGARRCRPPTSPPPGLSRAKLASIRDLAEHASDGRVVLERIGRLSDDDVIEHLTAVRGIGPWTAQMFLMFTLHRLDVWPTGDLGVRIGFAKAWGLAERPTPGELEVLGEPYRPDRSVVAWYCWRAADTTV